MNHTHNNAHFCIYIKYLFVEHKYSGTDYVLSGLLRLLRPENYFPLTIAHSLQVNSNAKAVLSIKSHKI